MSFDAPQSRNEAILQNILGASNPLEPPGSRIERLLQQLLNRGALPAVTATDNGKVLGVSNGVWAPVSGGGGSITVDSALSDTSKNPVQNKAIHAAFSIASLALLSKADEPIPQQIDGLTPEIEAENNNIYECGEVTSLTVSSAPAIGSFIITFTSGATATTLTMPATVMMPDGFSVEANTRYEINVRNGYALAAGWAVNP